MKRLLIALFIITLIGLSGLFVWNMVIVINLISQRPKPETQANLQQEKQTDLQLKHTEPEDSNLLENYEGKAFLVFVTNEDYVEFDSFNDAVAFAKRHQRAHVYGSEIKSLLWTNAEPIKPSVKLDVPLLLQTPELIRGCEVTSLAMLINYYGNDVSKLTLAHEVAKDPTPYKKSGGRTYFGNPNTGFVGDMYDKRKMGLGVYHGPIFDLLKKYFPKEALDLTGCDFEDLYYLLGVNSPVWVITNSTFRLLDKSSFEVWDTPVGPIAVTYAEHSVLVTGYDDEYIYFNDPLVGESSYNKKSFIAAWEQMGRQAVVVAY